MQSVQLPVWKLLPSEAQHSRKGFGTLQPTVGHGVNMCPVNRCPHPGVLARQHGEVAKASVLCLTARGFQRQRHTEFSDLWLEVVERPPDDSGDTNRITISLVPRVGHHGLPSEGGAQLHCMLKSSDATLSLVLFFDC